MGGVRPQSRSTSALYGSSQDVRIFVFLHVATMFTAVAASLGPWFFLRQIGGSRDVPALRRAFALALPIGRAIGPLCGLGAALRIRSVFRYRRTPFAPLLLIAFR